MRAGRRVPVSLNFLEAHLDTVIAHVERGALRCQFNSDSWLTTLQLRALFAPPVPALQAAPEEDEGGAEDEGSEEAAEEPEEQQEEEQQEEEQAEEAQEESEEQEASEEDTSTQDDGQDESGGEVSAEMSAAHLPEAWRTRNKKGLLALCSERKLEATDKLSNRELAGLLESWDANR